MVEETESIQSLGGKARAQSLGPADRKAIAQGAAEARWEKAGKLKLIPKATHEGPLTIGDIEIPSRGLRRRAEGANPERGDGCLGKGAASQGASVLRC